MWAWASGAQRQGSKERAALDRSSRNRTPWLLVYSAVPSGMRRIIPPSNGSGVVTDNMTAGKRFAGLGTCG